MERSILNHISVKNQSLRQNRTSMMKPSETGGIVFFSHCSAVILLASVVAVLPT